MCVYVCVSKATLGGRERKRLPFVRDDREADYLATREREREREGEGIEREETLC